MSNSNRAPEAQSLDLEKIREQVAAEAPRVAELGQWPDWMKPNSVESLTSRIPTGEKTAPGFDAGIACTLDLIPRNKQALSAALHAAYTPEKVAQVRKELDHLDPDSETAWWLSACKICAEDEPVDSAKFQEQLKTFEAYAQNPVERLKAANSEYAHKLTLFETHTYGIPFGKIDGCMQGAYVAGYPVAAMLAQNYGIYFIGTYQDSLGLEDFKWSEEKDKKGRAKSGPVFGSKQFVKCADEEEFKRALELVKQKLPMPEAKKD